MVQPPVLKATDTVVVAPGVPALKRSLVELISSDRYIDLGELPPAKGHSKPTAGLANSLDGRVILMQAADLFSTKGAIPDVATWTQCFSVYAAVVLTTHPERMSSMLMYMAGISKLSKKFKWPSWLVYDQNFRMEAAETGKTDWSKIDGGIFAQCFTGMALNAEAWCTICKSVDHVRSSCPCRPADDHTKRQSPFPKPAAKRYHQSPPSQDTICRRWNRRDSYMKCSYGDACVYQHKCSKCMAPDHGATRCPKGVSSGPPHKLS